MNPVKRKLPSCLTIALLTLILLASPTAHAAELSCGAWSVVKSPSRGLRYNELYGVAAVSASDVWAVGTADTSQGGSLQTLTEHWNGTNWSTVHSPNVGGCQACSKNVLYGVAFVSTSDVWAVGTDDGVPSNTPQTLTDHWNGTSWSIVKSPSIGTIENVLQGVAVVSASDVWAVGHYDDSIRNTHALIEHWNGTNWSIVTSPNLGQSQLFGVAAVSTSDVWAVGSYVSNGNSVTLTEHWNGTNWSHVSSPTPVPGSTSLNAVAVDSASNIWAVGDEDNGRGQQVTLIERWNGTKWSVVTSPNPGVHYNYLEGVKAISTSNVWAVGYHNDNGASNDPQTLTEHWNGTTWSVVKSPNPGYGSVSTPLDDLYGVTATDVSHVWAVGYYNGISKEQTLGVFYC